MLCNKKSHRVEKPVHHNKDPAQPKTKKERNSKSLSFCELRHEANGGKKNTCYLMMETCLHLYRLGPINMLCDNIEEVGRNLGRAHLSQRDVESLSDQPASVR